MNRRLQGQAARYASAGALTVVVLVTFAVLAGVGLSQNGSYQGQYGQYQYGPNKVVICHHTHSRKHPFVTISVAPPAAQAHLKHHHGDHMGACTTSETQGSNPTSQGHGQGHGPSHDNGNHGAGGHGNGHGK